MEAGLSVFGHWDENGIRIIIDGNSNEKKGRKNEGSEKETELGRHDLRKGSNEDGGFIVGGISRNTSSHIGSK